MKRYLFTYHHQGSDWSFDIPADSEADAIERLKKLPMARLEGTISMRIPAWIIGKPIAKLIVRTLNFFHQS